MKLRSHNLRKARLLAAIPVGRVCPGCKQPKPDTRDWRLTIYGDAVCGACKARDIAADPQLYSQPELVNQAWKRSVRALREKQHTKSAHVCEICSTESATAWVRLTGTKKLLCTSCFATSQDIQPGTYREDKHRRVFQVTSELRAKYPFGEQKIPRISYLSDATKQCGVVLFELQRDKMFALVSSNLGFVNGQARQLHKQYGDMLTDDQCYDIALQTMLKSATLFDPEYLSQELTLQEQAPAQYLSYASVAIRNAALKAVRDAAIRSIGDVIQDTGNLLDTLANPEDTSGLEAQIAYDIEKFANKIKHTIGVEDWHIYSLWVLYNKTQKEIGIMLGLIPSSVSARLAKISSKCFHLMQEYLDLMKGRF